MRQITTGTVCHLEAQMVATALEGWDLGELDYLFLENVGNLVRPSSYDLGENLRLVALSVTEGEDILAVRQGIPIVRLSAKTGEGVGDLVGLLARERLGGGR